MLTQPAVSGVQIQGSVTLMRVRFAACSGTDVSIASAVLAQVAEQAFGCRWGLSLCLPTITFLLAVAVCRPTRS